MNNTLATTAPILPAEIQEQVAAIMKEDKGVAYDPLTLKASLRVDRWWLMQRGSEEPMEKREALVARIFLARKTRAAYGSREQKAPSCVSLDGCRSGTINEKFAATLPFAINTGQPCKTCPMNQFGTGRDQNGALTNSKFCGERRLLLALIEGYEDPVVISIPTMSAAAWDTYEDQLAKHLKTSYITQVTRISISSKERIGSKDVYGVAKFESLGFAENIPQVLAARTAFGDMLGVLMQQTESEVPSEKIHSNFVAEDNLVEPGYPDNVEPF